MAKGLDSIQSRMSARIFQQMMPIERSPLPRSVIIDRVKIEVAKNESARSGGVDVEVSRGHRVITTRVLNGHPVAIADEAKGHHEKMIADGVKKMIAARRIVSARPHVNLKLTARTNNRGAAGVKGVAAPVKE